MNFIDSVIFVIMLLLITFYIQSHSFEVEYVVSNVDGRRYLVKGLPDKKEAADVLAKLNKKLQKLINEMKSMYPEDEDVRRLANNYNPDNLSEGTDESNYTSYSVNKGEQIVFCLRSRDGRNKLVPMNVLTYVAIHELAHLMTKEIGHPPVFWKNFKRLLVVAVEKNIYQKTDYSSKPTKYCGLTIKSSVI